LLGVLSVLAVTMGLVACGGSTSRHDVTSARAATPATVASKPATVASEQPRGPADPAAIVARVGPYSITGAAFNRWIEAALNSEPPSERLVAPHFSACVANLQAESVAAAQQAPGPAQLEGECRTRYQELLESVLDRLISSYWLIGGASELGVPVSTHQVQADLERYRRAHFSSEAQLQHSLAGRTLADLALQIRAQLASQAIQQALKDRAERLVGQPQIVAYYKAHRFLYLADGERNVEIARTESAAAATKVRSEIESGKSFATVVEKLTTSQPANSNGGLVIALKLHVYGEPNLNEAIFTTAPGVLSGPINTWFGYFVFRVTKITANRESPLAEVQASIRRQLVSPLERRALSAFIAHWTTTWTGQTVCSKGDLVPKCRGFSGSPADHFEEPSPLAAPPPLG
jgi:foldase protein PrsA